MMTLTLRTRFNTDSKAVAKDWLAGLVDQDAFPFESSIEAEEESSKPHIGPDHPCAKAAHALTNALARAFKIQKSATHLGLTEQWASEVIDACGVALEQLAKALELLERNEHALGELRAENVRMSHEVDAARTSYLALMAEYEADKKLWAQIEAWNTRLVSQIKIVRTARQMATPDAIPHSLRIAP